MKEREGEGEMSISREGAARDNKNMTDWGPVRSDLNEGTIERDWINEDERNASWENIAQRTKEEDRQQSPGEVCNLETAFFFIFIIFFSLKEQKGGANDGRNKSADIPTVYSILSTDLHHFS